jgi:cyclic beta-1,2-glucan synthetase
MDPCAALRTSVSWRWGEDQIAVLPGSRLARRPSISYAARRDHAYAAEIGRARRRPGDDPGATPDRSLDIMLNGWLVYQTRAAGAKRPYTGGRRGAFRTNPGDR